MERNVTFFLMLSLILILCTSFWACGSGGEGAPDVRPIGTQEEKSGETGEQTEVEGGQLAISQILPIGGRPGSKVMITGSGFREDDTLVSFDGIEAQIQIPTTPSATLIAIVPESISTVGPVDVMVFSESDDQNFDRKEKSFTILKSSAGSFIVDPNFEILRGQDHFGCEFGDFNNDGYPDLVYVRNTTTFGIYPNLGTANPGKFGTIIQHDTIPPQPNLAPFVGDFDRDGFLDLIIAKSRQESELGTVELHFNNGTGDFSFSYQGNLPTECKDSVDPSGYQSGVSGHVSDFNGDGFLDFFMGQGSGASSRGNQLFFNEHKLEERTFANVTCSNYNLGQTESDLTSGGGSGVDYDLDGDVDLFVCNNTANRGSPPSRLYYNKTTILTFDANPNFNTLENMADAEDVSWGFLNEDDHPDIVLVGPSQDAIFFTTQDLDGDGVRNLTPQKLSDLGSSQGKGVAVADFDGDGDQDIFVVGRFDGDFIKYYVNTGGAFTERSAELIGPSEQLSLGFANQVIIADVEQDGDLDIAVCRSVEGTILLLNEPLSTASPQNPDR